MITTTDRTSRLKAGFIRPGVIATNNAAAPCDANDDDVLATPRGSQSPRKRQNFRPSPTSGGYVNWYVFAAAAVAAVVDVTAATVPGSTAVDDDTRTSYSDRDDEQFPDECFQDDWSHSGNGDSDGGIGEPDTPAATALKNAKLLTEQRFTPEQQQKQELQQQQQRYEEDMQKMRQVYEEQLNQLRQEMQQQQQQQPRWNVLDTCTCQ